MISFYHPNSKNTGFACSFSQSPKDGSIYGTLIKQAGWDNEKKIGSFLGSRNDPTKNVTINLGQVEVGAILDCIDRNRPFSSVHDTGKLMKGIQFIPWLNKPADGEKPVQKGHSFSINITDKEDSTKKNALYFGFTFPEARLIREFLIYSLQRSFESPSDIPSQVQVKQTIESTNDFV